MDNVGIVVESLDDTISFFAELGLTLEGRATVARAICRRGDGSPDDSQPDNRIGPGRTGIAQISIGIGLDDLFHRHKFPGISRPVFR
jgi:hypothetical protein